MSTHRTPSPTARLLLRAVPLFASLAAGGACRSDRVTGSSDVAGIRFVSQPGEIEAGAPFSLRVELVDPDGRRATGAAAVVVLSLNAGAEVSGPTSVSAVRGLATFADLRVTRAGADYSAVAAGAGFHTETAPFAIVPAPPSLDRSSLAVGVSAVTANASTPLRLTVLDAYGNPHAGVPVSVTSSLAGSTVTPAQGTTNPDGMFETVFRAQDAGSAAIAATVSGQALGFPNPLIVADPCPPAPLTFPGNVQGALPAGQCTAQGRPAAVYRFTMPTAGGAAFTTTAGFNPSVVVTHDFFDGSVELDVGPAAATLEWLLPAGTYFYRIGTRSGNGAFTIAGATVAANTGANFRLLVAEGTYTNQSLGAGDRDFGDGTFYDVFFIRSARPCTITMHSAAFDPWLWIDEAGQPPWLAIANGSAGDSAATVSLPACQAGPGNPLGLYTNSNQPVGGQPWFSVQGPYTLTITYGDPTGSFQAAPAGGTLSLDALAAQALESAMPPAARAPRPGPAPRRPGERHDR